MIDVNEFQQLFDYINQWKATFEGIDKDRSGRIEENELSEGKLITIGRKADLEAVVEVLDSLRWRLESKHLFSVFEHSLQSSFARSHLDKRST